MSFEIETDRLVMRPWRPDDLTARMGIFSDAEVMKFIGRTSYTSAEVMRERISRQMRFQFHFGFSMWAVLDKTTREIIGNAGLQPLEGSKEIEVGYHFRRDVWGRGYATETARASLAFGLRPESEGGAGLRKIVGITHPDNVASQRVLVKAGLTLVGPSRHYDTDVLLFEILAAPV